MTVELQDAATVVLLRDGAAELEVLMAKRNKQTRFSAGAFVFPGGAVDAQDAQALAFCCSVDARVCQQDFAEADAQRYYLAAARELFEEVGLWLFGGSPPADAQQLRKDLHAGRVTLADVLAQRPSDACDLAALKYYRFWTTPPGMPRRYRTRFFAALAPADQEPVVDGIELTELCWTAPGQILQQCKDGEVDLIFPTIKELEYLASFACAADAWQAISAIKQVDEVRTRHRIENGRLVEILMPGEPGYTDLPGW